MSTARRFAEFAAAADAGGSPIYAEWARGIAADPDLTAIVDRAREQQRQPVLAFAVARWLGAQTGPFEELRPWLRAHADEFVSELDRRHTQTNDVRRVGPVAVALACILNRVDGHGAQDHRPVALLEVGTSAGLGLYPDRYDIAVDAARLGDPTSAVRIGVDLDPASTGALPPGADLPGAALPEIAFRAGLDLAPLDMRARADRDWLETLLWPGQSDRIELLRSSADIVAANPPALLAGDAVDRLDDLVALAPAGTRPVVVTSGTLVYLTGARRQAFVDRVAELGVQWISYERTGLLTGVHATLPDQPARDSWFATLAVDGRAIGLGDAHGTRLHLL